MRSSASACRGELPVRKKRRVIAAAAVLLLLALVFAGYQIYRHPAVFRDLSDHSLEEEDAEGLRESW